ncbi:MAG: dihydroxy-acid dehydratase, partial [Verrucomicrobiota bacterium]
NLLLHVPAIAHAAGLQRPAVADWVRVNKATSRLVDALPNGPRNHPTVQVFLAGGVPEVMLHLRDAGLLHLDVLTVTGQTLGENLAAWETSERRTASRERLRAADGVDPDDVIMSPARARAVGLSSAVVFPRGNLAPEGAVIKATSIDPSVVDADNVYRHTGPARVFTSEAAAIQAIKGQGGAAPVKAGDVVVLLGCGPAGTGMEETYQLTSALRYLPWGKHVPILTDARFSGVSTGACIGHIGPEALAGGPIAHLRDGDEIAIEIDRNTLTGSIDYTGEFEAFRARPPHPDLRPHPKLPADTRLWAALQEVSGGTWGGCVYDVDAIVETLRAGMKARREAAARAD